MGRRWALFIVWTGIAVGCGSGQEVLVRAHERDARGADAGAAEPTSGESPVVSTPTSPASSACDAVAPVEPVNPFSSPPECELRPMLVVTDAQGAQLKPRNHWCQYGSCGPDGRATCATYEVRTVGVPWRALPAKGVCRPMCRIYQFTEVVCGTTSQCELHDSGYDLCARQQSGAAATRLCSLEWDCWVDQNNSRAEWCHWIQGRPGPRGYTHLRPYAREKVGIPGETPGVPYVDVEGECPPDESLRPELPTSLRGLTVSRQEAVYLRDGTDPLIPATIRDRSVLQCVSSSGTILEAIKNGICPDK